MIESDIYVLSLKLMRDFSDKNWSESDLYHYSVAKRAGYFIDLLSEIICMNAKLSYNVISYN